MSIDHGALNIKGRTSTINCQLDKHFKNLAAQSRDAAKYNAARMKALRAEAKQLVQIHGFDLAELAVSKGTNTLPKAMKQLKSDAHWDPEKVITMMKIFLGKSNADRQEQPAEAGDSTQGEQQ